MAAGKTIVIGYNEAVLASLQAMKPEKSVLLLEEPDIVSARGIADDLHKYPVVDRLFSVEYVSDHTADAFFAEVKDLGVSSIIPVKEYTTPFAARLAERFGLPGATYGASLIMRDKNRLRRVTSAHGIRNPESRLVSTFREVEAFADEFGFPLIIKPANRQGSVGTVIIHNLRELKPGWSKSRIREEGVALPSRGLPELTLVEQFISGQEFSVEALVWRGNTIFTNVTMKDLFDGVNPVERAHTVPAPIPEKTTQLLIDETRRVLQAAGFDCGIIHCEWILADGIPYLVECAGRLPGDGIVGLIEKAYEFDVSKAYFRMLEGDVPNDLPPHPAKTTHVRFLGGMDGKIRNIEIDDAALSQEGITDFYVTAEVGQRTFAPTMSSHRLGAITIEAEDADRARMLAEQAIAGIRISYRKPWHFTLRSLRARRFE